MSKAGIFLANTPVICQEHLAMLIAILLLKCGINYFKDRILKSHDSEKQKYRLRHNGKQMPLCLSARGVASPTGFRVQEYEIELM